MFETLLINDADFDKIILHDKSTNTSVEILPTCGAILHAFTIINNGEALNVIANYQDRDDFKNNVESKGFRSCKLSPFVCRLNNAQYQFGEKNYTVEKFLMKGHALHGLLYDAVYSVQNTWANEESCGVDLLHQYKANDKGFPFKYNCAVRYELSKDNNLKLTTTITNEDAGMIPIQDGWHPYFSFGGKVNDLQLEFQSKEKLEFDEGLLPTGKLLPYNEFNAIKDFGATELDNCFTLNFAECQPMCTLRDPQKKLQLEIAPDASYPYLQIYTPPDRQSIAIENLTGAPDGFNNGIGLKTLMPNESSTFTTNYKITSLKN